MPGQLSELDEWKQAASVEAGLRREFKAEADRLRAALEEIANHRIDSELASREKRGMAVSALKIR